MSNDGMVNGASISAREVRIIDRSRLRGYTMEQNQHAIEKYIGSAPDYMSGVISGTVYGYNANTVEKDVANNMTVIVYSGGISTLVDETAVKNYTF
jgi:phosphoribosylformimino-5-aminoimidazole carboxamide ribonucleotide (ProFAR) isomerase